MLRYRLLLLLLLLLLIIGITFSGSIQKEYFVAKPIQINNIKHLGNFSEKRETITSFPLPLPLDAINPPPLNSTVQEELLFLQKLVRTPEKMDFAKKVEEEGVFPIFLEYCGTHEIMYDHDHLQRVAYDLETYCLRIQYMYKRPSPAQLAVFYNINLGNDVHISKHPSYPALPTFQSKVLAHVISYNNPDREEELHNLAKKIELSRLYGGYNYPSDNKVALHMANLVHKYVKHLETS